MLRWTPYVFLRVSPFFILGIVVAIYSGNLISPVVAILISLTFIIIYLVLRLWLIKKRFYKYNFILGVTAFSALFFLGYANLQMHNQALDTNHLLYQKQVSAYHGIITSTSKETARTFRYAFEVDRAKDSSLWHPVHGKMYLYISKEAIQPTYGDGLIIVGGPQALQPPMNPGEFNYKQFLSYENIYHSAYVKDNFAIAGHSVPDRLMAFAYKLRSEAALILEKGIPGKQERNIAKALVLGIKDGLDNEIKSAYAASGAMHVLAVSGLHVGIVYGIILLIFKPFRKSKLYNWLLATTSLVVLWLYAMVTGFSPSVLRAVTMFSFIAVAQASGRNTNIYNTLAASAFILLLFNPYLVMSVGFQLSYVAVIGIVYFQPRIYRWFYADSYVLDKIWAITAVSLAAQLVTFPLSVLYFHQFPSFFLLSNLIVIPAAFIILCSGLSLLLFSFVPFLAQLTGELLYWLIHGVNKLVFFIEGLPYSQITDIEITTFQAWMMIIAIIGMALLFEFRKFKYALLAVISLALYNGVEAKQILETRDQQKMVIYNVSSHTVIDLISGNEVVTISDSAFLSDKESQRFHIKPNHLRLSLNNENARDIKMLDLFDGQGKMIIRGQFKLLVLSGINKDFKLGQKLSCDMLLLTQDFHQPVDWLSQQFDFDQLIIDGSMRYYYVDDLLKSLDDQNIAYHSVYHNGALTIDLNQNKYELYRLPY